MLSGSTLAPVGGSAEISAATRRLQDEGAITASTSPSGLPHRNRRGPPQWPEHLLRPQWQQGPGPAPPLLGALPTPSPAPSGPAASQRRRPTLPGGAQCPPPPGRPRPPGLRGQGGATGDGGVAGVLRAGEAAVLVSGLRGRGQCPVCVPLSSCLGLPSSPQSRARNREGRLDRVRGRVFRAGGASPALHGRPLCGACARRQIKSVVLAGVET